MKNALAFLFFIIYTSAVFPQQEINNFENQFRLAQSYEQSGQLEKAEKIYLDLLGRQSWNVTYVDALNKLYIKQKKYEASVKLIQGRIATAPGDVTSYGMLGSTYYLMDEREKANEVWEKGIQTNPSSPVVYRVIANYAIENRAFDKATEILKRGQANSDDPNLFSYDLANIYSVNMNFKAAADEYCSLLEKLPEQIAAVKSRMGSYLSRPSAALETLETVKSRVQKNPSPALLELLATIYRLTSDYSNAFQTTIRWDKSVGNTGNNVFIFAQQAYGDRQFKISADAYKYITDNFPASPFLPISRIGYARALEASLDEQNADSSDNWKPYSYPEKFNSEDYLKIINTYNGLIKEYPQNAVAVEALFRNAEIENHRLHNLNTADSLYEEVIKISPVTNYALQSYLARVRIALQKDNINNARELLKAVYSNPKTDSQTKNEANFLNGKIEFWKGNFSPALKYFRETAKDLSGNFTNDALEISALIGAAKNDSSGLAQYASADFLAFRNKFSESAEILGKLAESSQNPFIKAYSSYKFAEMLIAENKYDEAVKILEIISDSKEYEIFSDKATFLLAMTYGNGLKNYSKSGANYEKILDKFPDSLYFDSAREFLNKIKTNIN